MGEKNENFQIHIATNSHFLKLLATCLIELYDSILHISIKLESKSHKTRAANESIACTGGIHELCLHGNSVETRINNVFQTAEIKLL
jgi:hypothetical protein